MKYDRNLHAAVHPVIAGQAEINQGNIILVPKVIAALKEIRLAWKIPVVSMVKRSGVGDISKYENGSHSPRLSSLERWADALGYEIVLRPKPKIETSPRGFSWLERQSDAWGIKVCPQTERTPNGSRT